MKARKITKVDAIADLEELHRHATILAGLHFDEKNVAMWRRNVRVELEAIFGKGSGEAQEFADVEFDPMRVADVDDPEGTKRMQLTARRAGVEMATALLETMIEQIKKQWESEPPPPPPEPVTDLNDASRRILGAFYAYHQEHTPKHWSIGPCVELQATTKLSEADQRRALGNLEKRGLVKAVGIGSYTLDTSGMLAWEDQLQLDAILPLARAKQTRSPVGVPSVEISTLVSLLTFVSDPELRKVIEGDLAELKEASERGLHKCVILLSGSILEAALIDVLQRKRNLVVSYRSKPKFPDEWSLAQLIDAAGSDQLAANVPALISETAKNAAGQVTDHRDLIHPHRCVRSRVHVDAPTAVLMMTLLWRVLADLESSRKLGTIDKFMAA